MPDDVQSRNANESIEARSKNRDWRSWSKAVLRMPTETSRYPERLKQGNMPASRNASVLRNALLILSLYLNPMSFIIFSSIIAPTVPFQLSNMNGMRQHDFRERNSGAYNTGWASTLRSPSIPSVTPITTFVRLSAAPIPSDSQSTQQNGSAATSRDMATLSEWSRSCDVVLADGVELTEDLLGDWSLTTTKSIQRGTSIMTVPAHLILSSDIHGDSYAPYYSETDMKNVKDWMEAELESGPQAKQDYLPEYMLVYKLLLEVYMGTNSRWHPWLQSLPTTFSTGLYLDEVERNHVERMTGDYIKIQRSQYQACLDLFQKFVSSQESKSLIPTEFLQWMLSLQQYGSNEDATFDNLVQWAYSIVFTRSWRSPDRTQAQIVPLGDLANHDSQLANLKPGFRKMDGAFQFFVTNNINVVGSSSPKLYLSYGLTYAPARFLVIFGFCDVTAAYIDANLDFLQPNDDGEWPMILDHSQLVASTLNGALSEDVWIAFLYKILQKSKPDLLPQIKNVFDNSEKRGNKLVEELLEKYEFDVGMEIQAHYQRLLETDFVPIEVIEKDLVEHPNLSMVVNYNLFIRETYLNILEHINVFLTQCTKFKALSSAEAKNELSKSASDRQETSLLQFQSNSTQQVNQTPIDSRNNTTTKTPENKTKQQFGKPGSSASRLKNSTSLERKDPESKSIPSISNKKDSTKIQRENTISSKTFENSTASTETSQESSTSNSSESKLFPWQTPYKAPAGTKIDKTVNSKNADFFEKPQESSEIANTDRGNNTIPQISKNEQMAQDNFSPNGASTLPSEYSDQQAISPEESQETENWNSISEMNQTLYSQDGMSQGGSNLNATSRFSSENFSLQAYSSKTPDSYDGGSNGISKQGSQNVPIGDFNPEYYAARLHRRTEQNVDLTATPRAPNGNVDPQPYSDGTPFFDDGESTFIPDADSNFFPDAESNMKPYTFDQWSQHDPNSQTMPMQEATSEFLYGNTDSESYSTAPFDYGNSNLQSYPNGEAPPGFPDTDIGFQPYSDSQTVPTQESIGSTGTGQYDYGNTPLRSYFTGEAAQTNGVGEVSQTNGIGPLSPAFPNNANSDSQSYPTNGQQMPTTEGIDSKGTNGIPDPNMGSQGYGENVSTDQRVGSSQQQAGVEFVSSYAESLVSDQRGNPQEQSAGDGGTESSKETNQDIPSVPTTYEEYMKQRQEEQ